MKTRIGIIIGWTCTILVSAMTIFSGIMQLLPLTDPTAIDMVTRLGILDITIPLGITKLILALLYLIPRTSTVGFVLLVGYYAGAIATNITHNFTFAEYVPLVIVLVVMTIGAYFRNPELLYRLQGRKI